MDPPQDLPYAKDFYRGMVASLYGLRGRHLAANRYVACDVFSIADMAIWSRASLWEGQQQVLDGEPDLARWLDEVGARPGVVAGQALRAEMRADLRERREVEGVLVGCQGSGRTGVGPAGALLGEGNWIRRTRMGSNGLRLTAFAALVVLVALSGSGVLDGGGL